MLKVHNSDMLEETSIKYLGNIVSSHGGITETIEDRRNKGWGKVSSILGILSEVDLGNRRVEVGLLLRKAILVNTLLFTSETWSGVQEAQIRRLEQVDEALLRSLLYSAHSKVALEFLHLESGTLKFRHILSMNRMMYHHHLLTTDHEESINKIYDKQKEDPTKGDWYELLQNDFKFIGEEINEEQIKSMSKSEYKKHIKELVQIASYKYLMKEKEKHTKLDDVNYS